MGQNNGLARDGLTIIVNPLMGWPELVEDYLRELARRNVSPLTVVSYGASLREMAADLTAAGALAPAETTPEQLRAWQDELLRRGLGPATRKLRSVAVHGLLRWWDDPAAKSLEKALSRIRVPDRLPRPLPTANLDRLVAHFEGRPVGLVPLRDRALFWFLYSSGARISEALQVDRDDYHDGEARVRQKGGSEKLLIASLQAQAALADYLAARSDAAAPLFLGHRPGRPERLTRKGVQMIWLRIARELRIEHFGSHQLRHSCASDLWRSTHDLLLVAQHLGHRSLESTRGYVRLDTDARRAALERMRPGPAAGIPAE